MQVAVVRVVVRVVPVRDIVRVFVAVPMRAVGEVASRGRRDG